MTKESRKCVLFISNGEYGQTTVVLALVHEMLLHGNFEVHWASYLPAFQRLQGFVNTHWDRDSAPVVRKFEDHLNVPSKSDVVFYTLPGNPMVLGRTDLRTLSHSPGLTGALESFPMLMNILFAHTGEEYVEGVDSCIAAINRVQPDLVIVDTAFSIGQDACLKLNQRHAILSPVSYAFTCMSIQGKGAMFWKYPAYDDQCSLLYE
jgi:hypothetical protein